MGKTFQGGNGRTRLLLDPASRPFARTGTLWATARAIMTGLLSEAATRCKQAEPKAGPKPHLQQPPQRYRDSQMHQMGPESDTRSSGIEVDCGQAFRPTD